MIRTEKLKELIEENRQKGVDFMASEDSPEFEWIEKAEHRLGYALPTSYKWFLMTYGGGEICGEEIYSIYGSDFENGFGGDIVFQYITHQRSNTLEQDEIPLCQNAAGEIYFFKASSEVEDENNEYPVYVKRGSERELFAPDFAAFLEKRIHALCG